MTNEFTREARYAVLKSADVMQCLTVKELIELRRIQAKVEEHRAEIGKPPLECVVVESDWPEYAPTWKAIEARVTGAQPAPSTPDCWKPIPEKHPTFDLVDLRLADGSVLCECVPQSDGDYWWNGPSGEVFIDPKYAPVTHWRLAAAPEVKL